MTNTDGSPAPAQAAPKFGDRQGFSHQHLLGIEGLTPQEIGYLLDLADTYVEQNRRTNKKKSLLKGLTLINLFFETSTRTRTSFELAGKRLGCDVINMQADSWTPPLP
jgi:aspartate carbamoyltransferase catalytic subunit